MRREGGGDGVGGRRGVGGVCVCLCSIDLDDARHGPCASVRVVSVWCVFTRVPHCAASNAAAEACDGSVYSCAQGVCANATSASGVRVGAATNNFRIAGEAKHLGEERECGKPNLRFDVCLLGAIDTQPCKLGPQCARGIPRVARALAVDAVAIVHENHEWSVVLCEPLLDRVERDVGREHAFFLAVEKKRKSVNLDI